jgi:hypothetical protein
MTEETKNIHPPDHKNQIEVSRIIHMIANDPLWKNLYGIVETQNDVKELIFSLITEYQGNHFFIVWIYHRHNRGFNQFIIKQLDGNKSNHNLLLNVIVKATGFHYHWDRIQSNQQLTGYMSDPNAFEKKYKNFLSLLQHKKTRQLLHNDLDFKILTHVPVDLLLQVPEDRSDFYR